MTTEFERWLDQWKDEIVQIQEHTKSELPKDPHLIQADLSSTIRYFSLAPEILADVEKLLIDCRAEEILHIKGDPKYDGYAAPERKAIVEARLSSISLTRDRLKATCSSLRERLFVLQGQRRLAETEMRMTGSAE